MRSQQLVVCSALLLTGLAIVEAQRQQSQQYQLYHRNSTSSATNGTLARLLGRITTPVSTTRSSSSSTPPTSVLANSQQANSSSPVALALPKQADRNKTISSDDDDEKEFDGEEYEITDEDEDDEDAEDAEGNDDNEEDDEDDDEVELNDEERDTVRMAAEGLAKASKNQSSSSNSLSEARYLTDMFGNRLKLENNQTIILSSASSARQARSLGLIMLKAILLGPLIGLTIKAALIRGLMWALIAYALHLFFPALLSSLGLGTGLVGFARGLRPNYSQMLLPHLMNLQNSMPRSISRLADQYKQLLDPVIETIRSVPEGHCRYRAVDRKSVV